MKFFFGFWQLVEKSIAFLPSKAASSQTFQQLNNEQFNKYSYFCAKILNHDSKLYHLER